MKRDYRRHLPHQVPEGAPIFLTWSLKGAMPADVRERLKRERAQLERQPLRTGESSRERAIRLGKIMFARSDDFLDGVDAGPLHLKDPSAAKVVEDSILFGAYERYSLYAWCVMANHVHCLLTPRWQLSKITQGIKGYTAHAINRLQNESGRKFWVDESYDHWVRDEDELMRIIWYIENNPVKAGLCRLPEEWPWSSARFRGVWPAGDAYESGVISIKSG
jgi:REP element-mobilizing transposase RayT